MPTEESHKPSSPSSSAALSAFRNVSACNRCRIRKNRCDQRLPACVSCEKAGVLCVGYDPITKKEIPRSYVFYLETRVEYLESVLRDNSIEFAPAENFVLSRIAKGKPNTKANGPGVAADSIDQISKSASHDDPATDGQDRLNMLVTQASRVAVQGTSDSRYLGASSGISFARVVFAAVKSSVTAAGERGGTRRGSIKSEASTAQRHSPNNLNTSMRDSFFGLHTKPAIKPAPFPSRELGLRLANLYFQHCNPQFPILHRPEFMAMFDRVYNAGDRARTPRESYLLNIVFAIGAGVIVGKPPGLEAAVESDESPDSNGPPQKKRKTVDEQRQPEEYHASAIVHLEAVLSGSSTDSSSPVGNDLEELQAVLLLAGFALLRPVPPGLWYIIGVAVRLAIDLGLHADDGGDASHIVKGSNGRHGSLAIPRSVVDLKDKGKRAYVTDFRRRLWWSVYSFDRLVSSVVGRPFGFPDSFVTTSFPSLLDDQYITTNGINSSPEASQAPSYKHVAYHYFRLRLLHSEILSVLQYRQTQLARERGITQDNPYMLTDLPSPFLKSFDGSFSAWREDMDRRLEYWRSSAPAQSEIGVQFSPLFLELNYWQTILMLYRQSLSVPADLADDVRSATESVASPVIIDEQGNVEHIFMKVAEAGQKVLKLYRQLHRKYLVNYTYLSTHHLFMAGISFLYAIWHSPLVRSFLTLDDVDFTVLAATSVLDDLVSFCPPARACRDAFSRMTKATIKMCLATTGFGSQVRTESVDSQALTGSYRSASTPDITQLDPKNPNFPYALPSDSRLKRPEFEPNLRSLFSDEESAGRPFGDRFGQVQQFQMHPRQPFSSLNSTPMMQMGHLPPGVAGSNDDKPLLNNPFLQPDTFTQQAQDTPNYQAPLTQQDLYSMASPWSDMEFLDSISIPEQVDSAGGKGTNDGGLDMNFGLAWDGNLANVNWNDGSGSVDVFDGFFFGGTGGTGQDQF